MLNRLTKAISQSDPRLALDFTDGSSGTLDLRPLIERGGVFTALADPGAFGQAATGPDGRTVEWPGEVDLCADALRMAIDKGSYLFAS